MDNCNCEKNQMVISKERLLHVVRLWGFIHDIDVDKVVYLERDIEMYYASDDSPA